jgi:hypothetical protein
MVYCVDISPPATSRVQSMVPRPGRLVQAERRLERSDTQQLDHDPFNLTDGSFGFLNTLTAIKLATVSLALGQVGFLGALCALLYFFPANRLL